MKQEDRQHLKNALKVLSKKLTTEAESLDGLGQDKAAKEVRADIGQLDELMPRKVDEQGVGGFNEKQRSLARTGLAMLAKNTKAASGTCLGIGQDAWAEQCKAIAAHIEDELLPLVEEQPALAGATAE